MKSACVYINILTIISLFQMGRGGSLTSRQDQKERVITDLETIESPRGVRLDFSYNETGKGISDELCSAPGCPKSIDGYPWVYHGNPPCCHLAGQKGPCEFSRILYVEPGSPYGVCGCGCLRDRGAGLVVDSSPDGRYLFCWGTQVQDNRMKACYDLQTQGSCEQNQMLVKDKSGVSVTCVPQCPPGDEDSIFPLTYNSETGMCQPSAGGASFGGAAGVINPNECLDGEKYSSVLKTCVYKKPLKGLLLG